MFKKLPFFIMALVIVVTPLLIKFNWQDGSGAEFYTNSRAETVYRLNLGLSGKWNRYNSLRKAWLEESNILQNNNRSLLSLGESLILPSTESFQVAAKRFSVTNNWGSKTVILTVEGLIGKAAVYLNGIDNVNYLGAIDGIGGLNQLEITATRLNYDQPNVILIETSESSLDQKSVFSWIRTKNGRIVGDVRLEGVPETSLNLAETTASYDGQGQLVIHTGLWHHQSLNNGPWAVKAILRDNEQKIAECLLPVDSGENYKQDIKLLLDVAEPHLWNIDDPYLYDLEISLTNSRGDIDSLQIPIGLKTQGVDSSGRWLLNSETFEVKGIAVYPLLEAELRGKNQIEHWLSTRKSQGYNLIYFNGCFPNKNWLYSADQLGMGIWAEIPVTMVPASKLPQTESLELYFKTAGRHPSLLSWTVLKDLYEDPEKKKFLAEINIMAQPLPCYYLTYNQESILQGQDLEGEWGSVSTEKKTASKKWAGETEASLIWILLVVFIGVQNLRVVNWDYRQISVRYPKRTLRRAYFWQSLNLFMRMATLGGIITSAVYRFPINKEAFWFQGSLDFINDLQAQEPLVVWFFLAGLLLFCRLIQVGVAAPFFPGRPGALDLTVWLEGRYNWYPLAAAAWTLVIYGLPIYIAFLVYLIINIISFPFKVKDLRKAKAGLRYLFIVPFVVIIFIVASMAVHYKDLQYLWQFIFSYII